MSKRQKVACPGCGVPQSFPPTKVTIPSDGVPKMNVIVQCTACPYTEIVLSGPTEVVELQLDVQELAGKVSRGVTALKWLLSARAEKLEEAKRRHGITG